jgi:hypothetical protein
VHLIDPIEEERLLERVVGLFHKHLPEKF